MGHAIPLELLAPPPRRIRRRPGRGPLFGLLHVILLPHTVGGILMVPVFVFSVGHRLLGSVVEGRITDRSERPRSGRRTDLRVEFTYRLEGEREPRTARRSSLDRRSWEQLPPGTPVAVRVLRIGRRAFAALAEHPDPPLGLFAVWLVGWNGFMALIHRDITYLPLERRRLVRDGSAVGGEVSGLRVGSGKQTRFFVRYRYAPAGAAPLEREMKVRREEYMTLVTGAPVTVLHDPAKPRRSVAYELGDYEAVA